MYVKNGTYSSSRLIFPNSESNKNRDINSCYSIVEFLNFLNRGSISSYKSSWRKWSGYVSHDSGRRTVSIRCGTPTNFKSTHATTAVQNHMTHKEQILN